MVGQNFLAMVVSLLFSSMSFAAPGPITACYTVPVQASLKKFATFHVDDASLDYSPSSGSMTIRYRLPEDITGRGGVAIKLTGLAAAPHARIFSVTEQATGTRGHCVLSSVGITCMLHYTDLKLDHVSNQSYLKQKYQDDANLVQRLEVLSTFDGDAVGILELTY